MGDQASRWLIERIRAQDAAAWQDLIRLYQRRLHAFVSARIRDKHAAEDVVQETFLGFLRSLPHFDPNRELERYLFTIAAHKIRDHLRKNGRHPLGLLDDLGTSSHGMEPSASIRGPSSLLASGERIAGEEARLVDALSAILDRWRQQGDYRKLKCAELLFVAGWPNKQVAQHLEMTEQQVANQKFQLMESLTRKVQQRGERKLTD